MLCVVAAAVAVVELRPGPDTHLPATTPTVLLTALSPAGAGASPAGYSGTLVAQLNLDLPASAEASTSAPHGLPILLMAGAHTLRYWYGGPDRQRVALITAARELDVFRAGTRLWQWNSETRVAIRSTLPDADDVKVGSPVFPAPLTFAALTPQQLAARTVAAVDPSTYTSVAAGPAVAGRATYRLTLRPGPQTATRIARVSIDVDARTRVPLAVQVYARGQQRPSIDVAFTNISYRRPAADYFRFTPPPGATVRAGVQPQVVTAAAAGARTAEFAPARTGWSAVTAFRLPGAPLPDPAPPAVTPLTAVSGTWGSGYLLQTPLLCVLVTHDGRVLSGSVDPEALYAAAS